MFCCTLLYIHSSIAIILMGKRELVALLNLSSWCLVMVEWLFLTMQWGCLQFVIVVVRDHIHLLFLLHSLVSDDHFHSPLEINPLLFPQPHFAFHVSFFVYICFYVFSLFYTGE